MRCLNDMQMLKHRKNNKYRCFLRMRIYSSDVLFMEKTANMIMKKTLENGMRSGSYYFAIWAPFWMLWEPFWCVLGGLGRLLAVF